MSTMTKQAPGRRRRRIHSEEFKASLVRACQQPGVSLASVALANALNATMLRRWVVESERSAGAVPARLPLKSVAHAEPIPAFVQMPLQQPEVAGDIRIEVQRGALRVAVSWPASVASQCSAWLRDLLR
ncbi:transposase [Caenimonas koreensis]|uniref:transposase n=1 Tax=Caenimonas koreensis TaxID=367474 RepID=UPI0037850DB6